MQVPYGAVTLYGSVLQEDYTRTRIGNTCVYNNSMHMQTIGGDGWHRHTTYVHRWYTLSRTRHAHKLRFKSTCVLVHEGQVRERRFKKWGNIREAETEQKARDALIKAKLENYWVMAKSLEKGTTVG